MKRSYIVTTSAKLQDEDTLEAGEFVADQLKTKQLDKHFCGPSIAQNSNACEHLTTAVGG